MTTDQRPEPLLTPEALAAHLGVHVSWVESLAERLPHYETSDGLRYRASEAREWTEANR